MRVVGGNCISATSVCLPPAMLRRLHVISNEKGGSHIPQLRSNLVRLILLILIAAMPPRTCEGCKVTLKLVSIC